ncbi:MAG: methionyl-tRNA formyltransferase [Bacteroidota bacterium]
MRNSMQDLRIIFMGTPEFAVASLEILVKNKFNVVAVVTAPDKPKGRGRKLATSQVKDFAVAHEIPVLQPTNLKSPEFLEDLRSYNANLQVVVAFRMLPVAVWDMPAIGTFNLHGSLLPQYRGAAPINWAIINGEKETGVTTFFLKHEIDTGSIIFQDKEHIHDDDNVGTLYNRLMQKGAELVLKTVQAIDDGNYPVVPQEEPEVMHHAPKIFKETCEIDWHQPAKKVRDFIRGLAPFPGAWTTIEGKVFKIYRAEFAEGDHPQLNPGEYYTDAKKFLHMKTADGMLAMEEIQMEGKKRWTIIDYLCGDQLLKATV